MLHYISTRSQAPRLSFCDTALAGLASDGGLYVPDACPKISPEEIVNMAGQNYLEVAWRVIQPFVGDEISPDELVKMLRAAYKTFDTRDVVPMRELSKGFHVLELFHGPTLSFKDVALQFLSQVFAHILQKKKQKVTIVGATSGDTGSAAIEAFKGKDNVNIFILHPKDRVSEVQRRQMTTVEAGNVFNVAIEGSFDDCQDLVKAMFNDKKFREEMALSAVNSINWARIMAQVVYYVYAGARVHKATGKPVAFCVPTGNFGNVYAGYIAQSMGLPVEKLIVATNKNDILHRFFSSGRMKAEGVSPSLSPSMDIQISSNFERLLFEVLGKSGPAVARTMKHFREVGPFHLEKDAMERLSHVFASGRKDDAETLAVIKKFYQQYDYLADPHTAVGLSVAEDWQKAHPESAIVSLATAHPAKFPAAVKEAVGIEPELPERLKGLMQKKENYQVLPANLEKVQAFVRAGQGKG